MRWWRRGRAKKPPSLVRRLTLGYVAAHAAAILIVQLLLFPFVLADNEDNNAPRAALYFLRWDVDFDAPRWRIRPDADIRRVARENPGLWFLVKGERQALSYGPVPQAVRSGGAIPPALTDGDLSNIGAAGRRGEVSVEVVDYPHGRVTTVVGGVDPANFSTATWLRYYWVSDFYWIPLFSAFFTLAGALAAVPILLRSVRPTAQAIAALDAADAGARVPEAKVVREILPIVRALNEALERAARSFEERRRFIADVAHELRTPLAVLSIQVDALPEGGARADIQRLVYRLAQMVGQMLDAERLSLAARAPEPVDLVALAREAVADIAPLAISNGYAIAFSAEAETAMVIADRHAVSRAFANLLGNSVAHGGGAGTIRMHVGAGGVVDVTDEGPGIGAEARARIFQPFHRERWDRDGCGLGLYLVAEVMRSHGGTATVLPSETGAAFRLGFPAA